MSEAEQLLSRVAAMRKQLKEFRIIGGEGVTVHGSMEHGYAVSVDGGGGAEGGTGGGGGPTPTGACCIGTDCHVLTSADCATMGGTYQGDGMPCSPNPCITTGACCIFGVCTDDYDPDACVANGGDFQGLGTHCADITCRACCAGFVGFTDPSTHYLTLTFTRRTNCGEGPVVCTYVQISTFDLESCTASTGPLMDDPLGCESEVGIGDCFSICALLSSPTEGIIDDNEHAHWCTLETDGTSQEWVLSDPFTDCITPP